MPYVRLIDLYCSALEPIRILPVAIGTGALESRRPLGMVIIGGLLFSQLITLFLTPVIYLYLEPFEERLVSSETVEQNQRRDAETERRREHSKD